jgi:hypothetical protein
MTEAAELTGIKADLSYKTDCILRSTDKYLIEQVSTAIDNLILQRFYDANSDLPF